MTKMPDQIVPAPEQVETEEAVENNQKEPGEKNIKEAKEDAAPQISENNVADKDKDEAEKYITKGEENDKNKEIDKVKGDDDEKNEEGNKDDKKEEKKRKTIFRTHKCTVCCEVTKRKTQSSTLCRACKAQVVQRYVKCKKMCRRNGRYSLKLDTLNTYNP